MSHTHVPIEGLSKTTARGNRRATIRYRCAPATVGKVISTEDQEFQRAWIIDLSRQGIGMQLTRPVEAGRLLVVLVKSNDGTRTFELSARVMHCNPVPHDEWYVGCELTAQLTSEDLDHLL